MTTVRDCVDLALTDEERLDRIEALLEGLMTKMGKLEIFAKSCWAGAKLVAEQEPDPGNLGDGGAK